MSEYNPVRTFRAYCSMNIPSIYDDSLSYYEQICKILGLIKKLNDNIEIVKEDAEKGIGDTKIFVNEKMAEMQSKLNTAIAELTALVNSLRDEVPEIVENKLDNMVQTGEMQTLLAPILSHYLYSPLQFTRGDLNDFNSYELTNIYTTYCTNLPPELQDTNQWAILLTLPCINSGTPYYTQMIWAFSTKSTDLYTRTYSGSTWSAWAKNSPFKNILATTGEAKAVNANDYTGDFSVYGVIPTGSENLPEDIDTSDTGILISVPLPSGVLVFKGMQIYICHPLNSSEPETRIYTRIIGENINTPWAKMGEDTAPFIKATNEVTRFSDIVPNTTHHVTGGGHYTAGTPEGIVSFVPETAEGTAYTEFNIAWDSHGYPFFFKTNPQGAPLHFIPWCTYSQMGQYPDTKKPDFNLITTYSSLISNSIGGHVLFVEELFGSGSSRFAVEVGSSGSENIDTDNIGTDIKPEGMYSVTQTYQGDTWTSNRIGGCTHFRYKCDSATSANTNKNKLNNKCVSKYTPIDIMIERGGSATSTTLNSLLGTLPNSTTHDDYSILTNYPTVLVNNKDFRIQTLTMLTKGRKFKRTITDNGTPTAWEEINF